MDLARAALASDRSFASWDQALANLRTAPVPVSTDLYWKEQHLDLLLSTPIASDTSRFSIDPRLARVGLKVVTTIRFLPLGGDERAFELHGNPGPFHLQPQ